MEILRTALDTHPTHADNEAINLLAELYVVSKKYQEAYDVSTGVCWSGRNGEPSLVPRTYLCGLIMRLWESVSLIPRLPSAREPRPQAPLHMGASSPGSPPHGSLVPRLPSTWEPHPQAPLHTGASSPGSPPHGSLVPRLPSHGSLGTRLGEL